MPATLIYALLVNETKFTEGSTVWVTDFSFTKDKI